MQKTHLLRSLRLYITGFCMGMADLIPGVSGGTIAFVSGIYEDLLSSINVATGQALRLLLRGNILSAFRAIPFSFFIPLGLGIGSAIFGLAHALSWLLEHHPQPVWGFFFGLVLASTVIVIKRVARWQARYIFAFLLSTVGAFLLVGLSPVETPVTWWMIFLSGMIAICAMILPGISGSFILLLLGKYRQMLAAVVEKDFLTLIIFFAGCIIGISFFSRFLSWLFKHYHDISVAILAGVMLGSVRKIWPWQIQNQLALPNQANGTTALVILCILAGCALVLWLDRFKFIKEHTTGR